MPDARAEGRTPSRCGVSWDEHPTANGEPYCEPSSCPARSGRSHSSVSGWWPEHEPDEYDDHTLCHRCTLEREADLQHRVNEALTVYYRHRLSSPGEPGQYRCECLACEMGRALEGSHV